MRDKTLSKALGDLNARGITGRQAFPLPYKVLWDIGFNVRPPLFASPLQLFLINSIFFGVFWAVLMIVRFFLPKHIPIDAVNLSVGALIGGVVFGLVMTLIFRNRAKKLNLPNWESYVSKQ